jgi:toxin-antitoxin system PIN domain toxin
MKCLLDVNILLAAIWTNHSRHAECFAWLVGKELVVCPLAELGFLRISTNKKAINAPMEKARELLQRFLDERNVVRIDDDLPDLQTTAKTSEEVTDLYLANLAGKHGFKFATLDRNVTHSAVEIVA